MNLEAVYDEKVAPLMTQIIEICKAHGIPMIASYQLDPLPDDDDGHLWCTTLLNEAKSEQLTAAYRALRQRDRGFVAAMTITQAPPAAQEGGGA